MAFCYLDSSGLVKRYVAKAGSEWMREVTSPANGNRLYVAQITGAEVMAAIARRRQQGGMAAEEAATAMAAFRADFAMAYYTLAVDAAPIAYAMDMTEKHGLRGSDAAQLAA